MILTGNEILNEINQENIYIKPFDESSITTNSYDLTLGNYIIKYTEDTLDSKKNNQYEKINIPDSGLLLNKGDFVLGYSKETIGSKKYVPLIHNKSGIARLGLFIHVTADLIDLGSFGNTTFQLYATLPVKLYKGMKIAQVTFWKTKGKKSFYKGKYQGSEGPQASKNYQNF